MELARSFAILSSLADNSDAYRAASRLASDVSFRGDQASRLRSGLLTSIRPLDFDQASRLRSGISTSIRHLDFDQASRLRSGIPTSIRHPDFDQATRLVEQCLRLAEPFRQVQERWKRLGEPTNYLLFGGRRFAGRFFIQSRDAKAAAEFGFHFMQTDVTVGKEHKQVIENIACFVD